MLDEGFRMDLWSTVIQWVDWYLGLWAHVRRPYLHTLPWTMGRHCSHMKGTHSYSNETWGRGSLSFFYLSAPFLHSLLVCCCLWTLISPTIVWKLKCLVVLYGNINVYSTGVQYPIYFVKENVIGFMFVVQQWTLF